jgi:hypothetical protein
MLSMNSKLKTLVDLLNVDDYSVIEKYLLELNPGFHESGKVANISLPLYRVLEDALSVEDEETLRKVFDALQDSVWKRNILLQLVDRVLLQDDVNTAERYISQLSKEFQYEGNRRLLGYFARQGDFSKYQEWLRKSDKRKDKAQLATIARSFWSAYSKKVGIDKALSAADPTELSPIVVIVEAQIGILSYLDLSTWATKLLAPINERCYIDVQQAALKEELQQGRGVSLWVEKFINYCAAIDRKKKVKGTPFGERQLSLFQLGSLLVNFRQQRHARAVLMLMGTSSSKTYLQEKISGVKEWSDNP